MVVRLSLPKSACRRAIGGGGNAIHSPSSPRLKAWRRAAAAAVVRSLSSAREVIITNMRTWLLLSIVALLPAILGDCGHTQVRVLDDVTGQPVAGATVVPTIEGGISGWYDGSAVTT